MHQVRGVRGVVGAIGHRDIQQSIEREREREKEKDHTEADRKTETIEGKSRRKSRKLKGGRSLLIIRNNTAGL